MTASENVPVLADLLGENVEVRTRQYPAWARSWFSESQQTRLKCTTIWLRSTQQVQLLDGRARRVASALEQLLAIRKGDPGPIKDGIRAIAAVHGMGLTQTTEGLAWLRALGFVRRHGPRRHPLYTLQLPIADPDECVCGACPPIDQDLKRLLSRVSHACGKTRSNVLASGTSDHCGKLLNVLASGTSMFSRRERSCSRVGNIYVLASRTCNGVSSSLGALDPAAAGPAVDSVTGPSPEIREQILAATGGVGRHRAPVQPWLSHVVSSTDVAGDVDEADTA